MVQSVQQLVVADGMKMRLYFDIFKAWGVIKQWAMMESEL
jgi:hypothetical protein